MVSIIQGNWNQVSEPKKLTAIGSVIDPVNNSNPRAGMGRPWGMGLSDCLRRLVFADHSAVGNV